MSLYDQTWGRLFAAGYDWFLAGTEKEGLREIRSELVARTSGRTLEVGAGTGLNLEHYRATSPSSSSPSRSARWRSSCATGWARRAATRT